MTGLPSDIKELVRSCTDLVALVGESVALHSQRGGRMFKALCPFHDDHNPSMEVNPERQTYRCWVCNKGGDCFSWVMEYEGVGFREALVSLANRAGVEIPKFQGHRDDGPTVNDKASLYEVLAWAETEFHRFLLQGAQAERAREYLKSRNFSKETIEQHRLGYHPDRGEWIRERAGSKYSLEQLLAARLIQERDNNHGYYSMFVDRLMFPIHDERGRCVAFGGRILPDSRYNFGGKYFNSQESAVFQKSKLIFGLDKARDAIRKTHTAVVMEGYVDCIKAHQAGVLNAVATLGTALTEQHVAFLKRLAERVVLVYDGDDAGKNAAVKAVEKFLAQDVDLRVLTLPENLDPDEFLDAHGAGAFESLISRAEEAWDVRYRHCVSHFGTSTVTARLKVLDEMLGLLANSPGLNGTTKENVLVAQLAQRLAVTESDARRTLRELRGRTASANVMRKVTAGESTESPELVARRAAVVSVQQRQRTDDLLECELLQLLFTAPHIIGWVRQEIGVDDLQNMALRELLGVCFDLADQGEFPEFTRVLAQLECPHLKSLAVWIDMEAAARDVAGKLAQDAATHGSATHGSATQGPAAEGTTTSPNLIRDVIDGLKWRRQQATHAAVQGVLAQRIEPGTQLDPELRELLQRAANFHQQRATRKLPS